MATGRWKALLLRLSTRDAAVRGDRPGSTPLEKQLVDHLAELNGMKDLETEIWPLPQENLEKRKAESSHHQGVQSEATATSPGAPSSGKECSSSLTTQEMDLWFSFWDTLRDSNANILIIVSDGTLDKDKEQRYDFPDGAPFCVRGEDLAETIFREFQRGKFQIILLAGAGTKAVGERISDKFDAMPLMVPPSILCWGNASDLTLEQILSFNLKFLEGTFKRRNPADQQRLDLRGAIHAFVGMRRGKDLPNVHFFPKNQIEEIIHIYYRLGLSAFELARRIKNIADKGFLCDFKEKRTEEAKAYAMKSSRFLFAELFGWLHVLRQQPAQLYFQREIRELEWAFSGEDTTPEDLAGATEVRSGLMQLYKFDIRAIGQAMVRQEGLEFKVLRYIDFQEDWDNMKDHFHKLEDSLKKLAERSRYRTIGDGDPELIGPERMRLRWIQKTLIKIVETYTPELAKHKNKVKEPLLKHIPQLKPAWLVELEKWYSWITGRDGDEK
ncbi:Hypothetical Protein FCC1311_100462 [Hondaea fermentalgiana]|uniref:Uncharacterized protein n=1 Tax=Hondaea fermentalgiana TaxID=2315210 RepID=A0A2R5GYL3_9STRA|nr:Hypothetical Protein FCC1311_100462 [Hondaea fermentalgiana]|eukprot:GBG33823.1 Hypothetical Protein FCC1311_100462 [Hondaea fermentalgiana]